MLKSVLSLPIPEGLNASDRMNGSISRATLSQVGVLSQGERRILLTFPPKITPLARKSDCAVMGRQEETYDPKMP